jgi:hypothetical protein
MIGSMNPPHTPVQRDHRRLQPGAPRGRSRQMLHATRGCPASVSIGVNRHQPGTESFHWTFVIEHSLSCIGSRVPPFGAGETLMFAAREIKRGGSLVRSARTPRPLIRIRLRCRWLDICIRAHHRNATPAHATPRCRLDRDAFFLIRRSDNFGRQQGLATVTQAQPGDGHDARDREAVACVAPENCVARLHDAEGRHVNPAQQTRSTRL